MRYPLHFVRTVFESRAGRGLEWCRKSCACKKWRFLIAFFAEIFEQKTLIVEYFRFTQKSIALNLNCIALRKNLHEVCFIDLLCVYLQNNTKFYSHEKSD